MAEEMVKMFLELSGSGEITKLDLERYVEFG